MVTEQPDDQVPQYLRDLRRIYHGLPPRTPAQEKLKGLWDGSKDDQRKFLALLSQQEKDHGGSKGSLQRAAEEEAPYEDFRNMPMSQLGPLGDELIAQAMWSPEQEREECARLAGKLMLAHGGTEDGAELVVAAIRKRAWGPNP